MTPENVRFMVFGAVLATFVFKAVGFGLLFRRWKEIGDGTIDDARALAKGIMWVCGSVAADAAFWVILHGLSLVAPPTEASPPLGVLYFVSVVGYLSVSMVMMYAAWNMHLEMTMSLHGRKHS